MEWHARAKQRANELGIRQEDLQAVFGVETRGAVGHYLSGRREPPVESLAPLADKLRLSLDELLRGSSAGASQPLGFDDGTMAAAIELLYLMAGARPEDWRFKRFNWAMVQVAARAVQEAEGDTSVAMAYLLAAMETIDGA